MYVCMYACMYSHQLCSDSIPGHLFPRADDVLVQAYSLVRTKVFNDWERWNFVEIILRWVCMYRIYVCMYVCIHRKSYFIFYA